MGSEGIRVGGRGVATGVRRESLGDEGERLSLTRAVEPLELDGYLAARGNSLRGGEHLHDNGVSGGTGDRGCR